MDALALLWIKNFFFILIFSKFAHLWLLLLSFFFGQIAQFLDSHGFLDYLERGIGSDENNNNLLDKLQDAVGRGQNPLSILPSTLVEPEIITISDPDVGVSGNLCESLSNFHLDQSYSKCQIHVML